MLVPDYCEPITAYRAWQVRDNGLLCGRHVAEPWPILEPMKARCSHGSRAHISNQGKWKPPPTRGCTCGIHGYTTLEQAKAEQASDFSWGKPDPIVFGAVKLWGRVLEHERGYRAEYAYPSELIADDEQIAARLAIYGVPVWYEAPAPPEQPDETPWYTLKTAINRATLSWWAAPAMPLGVVTHVSVFEEPGVSLLWIPSDEQRSPIETPNTRAFDERLTRVWKEIVRDGA